MIPIDQKEIYRSNNETDLKMIEVGVKALAKQQAPIGFKRYDIPIVVESLL